MVEIDFKKETVMGATNEVQVDGVSSAIDRIKSAKEVTLPSEMRCIVHVCRGRHLPELIRFTSGLVRTLGVSLDAKGIAALEEKVKDPSFLLDVLADKAEQIFILLPAMCSLKKADIDELLPDDLLELLREVWTVNQNFFVERVLPAVVRMLPAEAPTEKA